MKRSILTEKVARRGYHVMREYIVNPLARVRVEDVMAQAQNVPTIPADMKVDILLQRLTAHDPALGPRQAWPLVDGAGALVGVVTRGDLLRALEAPGDGEQTVLDAGTRSPVVTYPDEILEEAVDKMVQLGVGRLPVVARDDPRKLVGYLGRTGIAAAWQQLLEEEELREAGWVSRRARRLRLKVKRVLGGRGSS
jgi:CBS domain-containing protein